MCTFRLQWNTIVLFGLINMVILCIIWFWKTAAVIFHNQRDYLKFTGVRSKFWEWIHLINAIWTDHNGQIVIYHAFAPVNLPSHIYPVIIQTISNMAENGSTLWVGQKVFEQWMASYLIIQTQSNLFLSAVSCAELFEGDFCKVMVSYSSWLCWDLRMACLFFSYISEWNNKIHWCLAIQRSRS